MLYSSLLTVSFFLCAGSITAETNVRPVFQFHSVRIRLGYPQLIRRSIPVLSRYHRLKIISTYLNDPGQDHFYRDPCPCLPRLHVTLILILSLVLYCIV